MELQVVETLVMVVHVVAALAIIGLVLIQQGRGAEMGSGFGGGASSTVFGSVGSGNFLTRITTAIAIAFFLTSFGLAFFAKEHSVQARNVGIPVVQQQQQQPAEAQTLTIDARPNVDSEVPELEDANRAAPSAAPQEGEIPADPESQGDPQG